MSRNSLRKILVGLTLSVGLAAASVPASAYSSMYVFGDSLSDSGNAYALTGGAYPPAPYAGRFSNGPTYAEDLAAKLGLAAAPSLLGGTNYAFGGATAWTGSNIGGYATDLNTQVNTFRALSGAADANALYVVWAGANDLLNYGGLGIVGAQMGLSFAIAGLYEEGARNFLVMNMPNLGLTPYATHSNSNGDATLLSATFDTYFDMSIGSLRGGLAGSDIRTLDTFSLLNTVAANPLAYELNNVTDDCILAGQACTPNSYLFWDEIHPTAAGHQLIADAAFRVVAAPVPEPETYAMMLMGLGLLGLVARRRKLQAS